jgi:hypothetical protein
MISTQTLRVDVRQAPASDMRICALDLIEVRRGLAPE